jgi:hypothetical protein
MNEKIARRRRRASAAGRVALLAVVVAGAGFGCGVSRAPSPFASPEDQRIVIEVINHNFQDVTLHALWLGRRVRLGTILGTRSANFRLAWDQTELLRIELDQLAGESCVTELISATPGEIIFLEIPSHLEVGYDCF